MLALTLSDGTAYEYRGDPILANRNVDVKTGTIQVEGVFPNPSHLLRPGQYAKVHAATDVKKAAILVPQRAVSELQGFYQVAVVGPDNKIEIRPVQTGDRIGSLWIIEKGLSPGDRIVVEGLQKVKPGMVVNPKPAAEPTPPATPAAGKSNVPVLHRSSDRGDRHRRHHGHRRSRRDGGLPVAQFPDIVPPQIIVSTTYPGADAVTIEQSVATPIEQQMNGVDKMLYMQSINANDNTAGVRHVRRRQQRQLDQVNTQNRLGQAQRSFSPPTSTSSA